MEDELDDLRAAVPRQHHNNNTAEKCQRAARDVAPGECWAFRDHRSMAEVIAAEGEQ
jgi:hypothetical protein